MSVAKRKWQEMEKLRIGDMVWVAPFFWNYPGGWLKGVVFSNDGKNYKIYFPLWKEFKQIPIDHDLRELNAFDYTQKRWKIGDKVQVNNTAVEGQTSDAIWWEAIVAQNVEDGDQDILIEWCYPGMDDHEQHIVPLDSIRSAQNQVDLN